MNMPTQEPNQKGRSPIVRILLRRLVAIMLLLLRKLPEIRHVLYSLGLLVGLVFVLGFYAPRSEEINLLMVNRFKFPPYWERVVLFALLGVVARRLRYRNRIKRNNWGLVVSDILTDFFLIPITTLMIISLASILRIDIGIQNAVSLEDANPMILNGVSFILGGYSSYQLHQILGKFRNTKRSSQKRTAKKRKSTKAEVKNIDKAA